MQKEIVSMDLSSSDFLCSSLGCNKTFIETLVENRRMGEGFEKEGTETGVERHS